MVHGEEDLGREYRCDLLPGRSGIDVGVLVQQLQVRVAAASGVAAVLTLSIC